MAASGNAKILMTRTLRRLDEVEFDNLFVRSLPADPSGVMRSRQVRDASYTLTMPTPVAAPALLGWSDALGAQLGLSRPARCDAAVEALAGNRILPGMQPYAARYGGHQFGNWAGQLGDGRAITLGEMLDTAGQRQELQLKGAGPTPYSRRADGRAVLRSSMREFLCSEAMFHLGIPTTRALSLVGTGDQVVRDMFYDGHPEYEPGAIVCRVAPSFVRFGHFEILLANEETDLLRTLADWVMEHHFPGIASYAGWFAEICRRTATLMVHWMRVGFVHGVMNTDNMSILGLTIDYGPYGWLEGVDMMWTPNTTDAQGRRYCYGRQPQIAYWNLTRLAAALAPLINDQQALDAALTGFEQTFADGWTQMLADKLGLPVSADEAEQDMRSQLFLLLQAEECDFTLFFRRLAQVPVAQALTGDPAALEPLHEAFYSGTGPGTGHAAALLGWLQQWARRVQDGNEPDAARIARMNATNPKYVLRNWLAQRAIDDAAQGDTAMMERLLQMMRRPYDEQPEFEDLAGRRPEWARNKPGCSALSCSS
jgi:serine/tyrosine/threonine adenylyltransferase